MTSPHVHRERARASAAEAPHRYAVISGSRASWDDATLVTAALRSSGAAVSLEMLGTLSSVASPEPELGPDPLSVLIFIVLTRCTPTDASRVVERLRMLRPDLPLIAVITLTTEGVHACQAAIRAGVDDVALLGNDDLPRLAARLYGRALISVAAREVLALTEGEVSAAGRLLFGEALRPGAGVPDASALALRLNVSYRTLVRRCEEARLPTPATLIAWSRILTAGYVARIAACTNESLARQLGYVSSRALRAILQRYAGVSLSSLREPDTFPRLYRAFITMLRELEN